MKQASDARSAEKRAMKHVYTLDRRKTLGGRGREPR